LCVCGRAGSRKTIIVSNRGGIADYTAEVAFYNIDIV
jgi:hypothetical protein